MRRRPGIAALENVARGIAGQPRIVPAGHSVSLALADTLSVSDHLTVTVTGVGGIPSAEAFGGTTHVQQTWASSYAVRTRRPHVVAEVGLLATGGMLGGGMAEHLVATPESWWLGFGCGLYWAHRLWEQYGPASDS